MHLIILVNLNKINIAFSRVLCYNINIIKEMHEKE